MSESLLLGTLLASTAATPCHAAVSEWNGPGDWNDGFNWSLGIPDSTTEAHIRSGPLQITSPAASLSARIDDGVIVNVLGGARWTIGTTLDLAGLSILQLDIGASVQAQAASIESGQLRILNGSALQSNTFMAGLSIFQPSRVEIQGPSSRLSATSGVSIGVNSEGTIKIWEGSTLEAGGVSYIGLQNDGMTPTIGTVEIDGGQWNANDIVFGKGTSAIGVLQISGPTARLDAVNIDFGLDDARFSAHISSDATVTAARMWLAGTNSNGSANVNQATLNITGDIVVAFGEHSSAQLTLQTRTTATAGAVKIATGPNSQGTLIIQNSGTVLTVNGPVVVGEAGFGTMFLRNSARVESGPVRLAELAGSIGFVDVSGSELATSQVSSGDGAPDFRVTSRGRLILTASQADLFSGFDQNEVTFSDGVIDTQGFTVASTAPIQGWNLIKTGSGTLTLIGDNTYYGTTIEQGTLQVGNGGTSGTIDGPVQSDGVLAFNRSDNITFAQDITGNGAVHQNGTGTLVLTGSNTYSGGTVINNGTLKVADESKLGDAAGRIEIAGGVLNTTTTFATTRSVVLSGGGAIQPDDATTLTLANAVTGPGALSKTGNGTLVLLGANTYSGGTTLAGGTAQVASDANLGAAEGGIVFAGGTLETTASFASARNITMTGNGTIETAAATVLTLGGSATGAGALTKTGNGTLVLTGHMAHTGGISITSGMVQIGDGGITGTLAGDIVNNGVLAINRAGTISLDGDITGTGTLLQNGPGTLVLAGTGSYTGETRVNTGTLLVNGDLSAATGATTVEAGAALGGTGTIGGSVDVAGQLTPGSGSNVPGTLTINSNLTLASTAQLNFQLGEAGVAGGALNDLVNVGGNLVLAGTLNVTESAGGRFGPGIYRLINYGGILTGPGLALGAALDADTNYVQTAVAGQVNLVSTTGLALNVWDGPAGTRDDGAITGGSGTWQLGGGHDWTTADGILNGTFTNGGFTVFMGQPGTVTIDNGNGTITAAGLQFATDGLVLTGDALTLAGSNAVIRVGTGAADGASHTATIHAPLTGNAALEKSDLGTLVLTGPNSYTGETRVAGGTLLVNGDQSAATGATVVETGATLGGTGTIGGSVEVAGQLSPGSAGNLPGTLTINGNLSLASTAQLNFQLGEAGAAGGALNDLVNVGGDLVLAGTLNVTESVGGRFTPGIYRLINYGGTLSGPGLTLGSIPAGNRLSIQTSVPGQVNLANAAGLELSVWDGIAGAKNDGEIMGGDGVWRMSARRDEWTTIDGSVNADYAAGSFAIFIGEPGTVTIDNSNGAVTASGLQFGVDGYVITGEALTLVEAQTIIRVGDGTGARSTAAIAASLAGAAQLVKEDAGTLILSGSNTYAGGTFIRGGTVAVSQDANLGAASGGISFADGTLQTTASFASERSLTFTGDGAVLVDAGATLSLNGTLSGTGSLTKAGEGRLVLTGENSAYQATTRVSEGTLSVNGLLGSHVDVAAQGRLGGNGQVGSVANTGIVAPGNSFGTLTIASDYASSGGTLEIDTALGDDASTTDRLVILGSTSGTTQVKVLNRDGLGGQTVEGIKIIDVAGASNGVFMLKGDYVFEGDPAVIGGAYAYRLYKNGIADPADGDWYLRSSLLDPAEGGQQPAQPPGSQALYQPGVPVYEGYVQTVLALNELPTLQERVGNRSWAGMPVDSETGIWGRIRSTRHRPDAVRSTSGTDKNITSWQMQLGVERTLAHRDDGAVLIGALTAQYGKADSHVASRFGRGSIKAEGYGVGATLSWYGAGGFYADGQAQFSWFSSDLKSAVLGELAKNNDGTGRAFSLELGKRAPISGSLSVTPQIQLVYAHAHFDRFVDPAGAVVSADEAESLRTRWGLSLDHQKTVSGNRSHLYGIVNISYEWLPDTGVQVSGTHIANREHGWWGELGLGGSYSWSGRVTLYAQGSGKTAFSDFGSSYSLKGSVGLRASF